MEKAFDAGLEGLLTRAVTGVCHRRVLSMGLATSGLGSLSGLQGFGKGLRAFFKGYHGYQRDPPRTYEPDSKHLPES